jgi:hypothetical protein
MLIQWLPQGDEMLKTHIKREITIREELKNRQNYRKTTHLPKHEHSIFGRLSICLVRKTWASLTYRVDV